MFISETGLPLTLNSPRTAGNLPAYEAFPLYGGEHLPSSVPMVTTGTQAGATPVGPLDLTPLVQANLNADLDASKMAVVQTPVQSYAVEYLPRYGLTQDHMATTVSTANSGQDTSTSTKTTSSSNPLTSLESSLTIAGLSANELTKLTSAGLTDLENALHLTTKKAAAKKASTSTTVAAQYLTPPLGESSSGILPTPAPEPSTWLVFGLLLGVGGWRHWAGSSDQSRRA